MGSKQAYDALSSLPGEVRSDMSARSVTHNEAVRAAAPGEVWLEHTYPWDSAAVAIGRDLARPRRSYALAAKRLMDILGASVALILAAPIMLLTAIAIKLEGSGPVLFHQVRVGRRGRLFRMFKFRTMCRGAERKKHLLVRLNQMSGPVFKLTIDPRVTRVGRFLRRYSIDELPQLLHVLTGEMSLVGPRPPLPEEVKQYEPWQRHRLAVKPGLTCLWQVNGRNDVDFDEWMRLDLSYITHWSLWLDVRILLKTVPAVLSGSGV